MGIRIWVMGLFNTVIIDSCFGAWIELGQAIELKPFSEV